MHKYFKVFNLPLYPGLLVFLLYVSPLHAYGKNKQSLPSGTICINQVQKLLTSWNATNSWEPLIPINGKDRFISPIQNAFGQWLYMEIVQKAQPTVIVSKQSQTSITKVTFHSDCSPIKETRITTPVRSLFSDNDLTKLMKKERDFLIYIWAPEMPLSFAGLTEIKSYAKSHNIPLHIFLYNGSSEQYAKKSGQAYRFPASYYRKIDSFDLRMRGVTAHHPVVFRFKNGSVLGRLLFGYKSRDEYAHIYKEILK